MTQTLVNGIRICTVDADERLTNFALCDIYRDGRIWLNGESRNPIMLDFAIGNKPLPTGNWTLLGRFNDITEETWKGVVESNRIKKAWDDRLSTVYKNYGAPMFDWHDGYIDTAT